MKVVAKNRKAKFNYEIFTKYEAGIVLTGAEIKTIRTNNANIQDSYVNLVQKEAYIINMHINNYKFTTAYSLDPLSKRKLLLHKREIIKISQEQKLKHYYIIPLVLYINVKGFAKLQIGLAKPKKRYDKREQIKNRDVMRKIKTNF